MYKANFNKRGTYSACYGAGGENDGMMVESCKNTLIPDGNGVKFAGANKANWRWCSGMTNMAQLECQTPTLKQTGTIDGFWRDDGCYDKGTKRLTAQVDDLQMVDWEGAGQWILDQIKIGDMIGPYKVKSKLPWEKNIGGLFLRIEVEDSSGVCGNAVPVGSTAKWADASWKDDGCFAGMRRYSRKVDAAGGDWEDAADYLIRQLDRTNFNGTGLAIQKAIYDSKPAEGIWVWVYVTDTKCGGEDPSVTSTQPQAGQEPQACFSSATGEYGTYSTLIMKPIKVGSIFTLECINWISGKEGKKTFLKGSGGSILTDDDVTITSADLSNAYHFKFERVNCQKADWIMYGSHVQLKAIGPNKYIQCGGGTCSGVDDSGNCESDKWQTFRVESASGRTGAVCYGDQVYLVQTVNNTAAITPAGNTNVWAVTKGTNVNSILRISGLNGSLYSDPSLEMDAYDKDRLKKLCEKDPANVLCTANAIDTFFSLNNKWLYVVLAIVCICFVCSSMGLVLKFV